MQWKRGIELLAGIAIGLCFFLVILWLLNFVFPHSSGIGFLARSDAADSAGRSLVIDGVDGDREVIAQLTDVRRDVKDRSARSVVWNRSRTGADLGDRHAVQSQKGGGATIAFNDKNRLELDESTLVVVRRPNRFSPSRGTQATVLFVDGTLRGRIGGDAENPMEVEILTSGGSIRAQGDAGGAADFKLTSTEPGSATLSVHGGAADIKWGDVTTTVTADHAVILGADGAPRRVKLPGRPKLSGPRANERFVYRSAPPQIDFRWSDVATAESYRLEIARDSSFSDLVYEAEVSEPEFVHGNLRAGRYWWRASARARDAESRPSRSGRFDVIRDQEPPPLSLSLPEGPFPRGQLTVQGTSEPGCRIVVGEDTVPVDRSGEFALALDLADGYNLLVVQAIDPAGNTAFVSREIRARTEEPGSSL